MYENLYQLFFQTFRGNVHSTILSFEKLWSNLEYYIVDLHHDFHTCQVLI